LDERLNKHNEGRGAKYTIPRRPVMLVHRERFDNASEAGKRESRVNTWSKSKKERLIEGLL
jgi:putative endonuclease